MLDTCLITNRALLEAFWHLMYFYDEGSGGVRRISYSVLDVEELGSVYEGLLEYEVRVVEEGGRMRFELRGGGERKSTGSYYTPHELVVELVRRTLDPVIVERRQAAGPSREKQEKVLLSIRVLDPACGSGHFLLEAARRIGQELARVRTGEDNPSPEALRQGIRDAITHCLYGVDRNPLAIELCRLALWIEGHAAGKPLTFLSHHIKVGDSLVGVLNLECLSRGIPNEAFEAVSSEDKSVVRILKKLNSNQLKALRSKQLRLPFEPGREFWHVSARRPALETISDDTALAVREKEAAYQKFMQDKELTRLREAAQLWTAAFFQWHTAQSVKSPAAISTLTVSERLSGLVSPQARDQANTLATAHPFFHWPLEFPEVFQKGGFDVVLSNPPWERIKLQEEEFFARFAESRSAAKQIVKALNAAARKKLIATLPQADPTLHTAYQQALHRAEALSRFLRASGAYPLTGRGDINTYSVFAERIRGLLGPKGRAGLILPTGIATDATNQHFFNDIMSKNQLLFLYDFENREGLFPDVDSRYRFALVGLTGAEVKRDQPPRFCFFATRPDHLYQEARVFSLTPAEIARVNPNNRTLPIFRTRQDAELTLALYNRASILLEEQTGHNPWQVRFLRMFDMANDSHLFRVGADLERAGYRQVGNSYRKEAGALSEGQDPPLRGQDDLVLPPPLRHLRWGIRSE